MAKMAEIDGIDLQERKWHEAQGQGECLGILVQCTCWCDCRAMVRAVVRSLFFEFLRHSKSVPYSRRLQSA